MKSPIRAFIVFSLLSSLAFSAVNNVSYAQEGEEEEPLTIVPFRSVYSVGMQVTLLGEVNGSFAPNEAVSVKVTNPDGKTYQTGSPKLTEVGSYSFSFKLEGADGSELGVHKVEATYKSLKAESSFEVKEKPTIEISLDKETYDLGDEVTISGKVQPRILVPVEIRIYGINNTIWKFVAVNADKIATDGTFSVTAGELLGEKVGPGTYKVEATYADKLATTELEFEVVVSGKAVAGGLVLVDQSGNKLDEIFVGQQVLIQADVRNNLAEKQSFAYLVFVKDRDGIPVSLSFLSGTLPASDTLSAAQSWVPQMEGSYSVEIFVWKSVQNPEPLSSKIPSTTLTVQP